MRVDRQAQISYGNVDDESTAALLWGNVVDWDTLDLPDNPVIPADGVDSHEYASDYEPAIPALAGGILAVDPNSGEYVVGATAIQNAIKDRIFTSLGSRWLRPDYGLDLIGQQGIITAFETERRIRLALQPDSDWYRITSYESNQVGSALIVKIRIIGPGDEVITMELAL